MSLKEQSILLLDDDADFCAALAKSLRSNGLNPIPTDTIENALLLAAEYKPALALVDLRIGTESGLKAVSELKSRMPAIRIVVLTGYSSIATAVEAIKLGAIHYLTKPASIVDILHAFEKDTGNPEADLDADSLSIKRLEWEHIQNVLARNNGNLSATARELRMHRRTLQRKLQKYPARK